MTSLYDTALNGMGLGTTYHDIDRMCADYTAAGNKLAGHLLLQIGITLMDLARAEREQAGAGQALASTVEAFQKNPTLDNAGWLVTHATRAQKATQDAKDAYAKIGEFWRIFTLGSWE